MMKLRLSWFDHSIEYSQIIDGINLAFSRFTRLYLASVFLLLIHILIVFSNTTGFFARRLLFPDLFWSESEHW